MNKHQLADAIDRLRGEWAERSGGSLTVVAQDWNEVVASNSIDADVTVFPSRYLGEIATRDWLRPVRPHVLESERFDAADVFPLVRQELMHWGGQVMALPLGVTLPAAGEPIGQPSAIAWLVQAAPNVVSNDRVGVFFDTRSMQPRITERPFIEALARLGASGEEGGRSDATDTERVPVLGYSDPLIAVTSSSRNAASAFQLLAWLASAEMSSQLARDCGGVMPVRRSLAASPAWYDPRLQSHERAALAETLAAMLSQHTCLLIPRIPGVDQYMDSLDVAVRATVTEGLQPERALRRAAMEWERITDAHGRKAQQTAYLNHLGLAEP